MSEGPVCRVWIVGFAGHRRLADATATKQAIRGYLEDLRANVDGQLVGRSSAAAGADLLFLEACGELGIPTSVVLPFPEDRFKDDFEDAAEWERALSLMAGAATVETCPGNEEAPEAYHLAAHEVLAVSDVMLFIWDGEPARGIGGTGESVEDARGRKLPLQIIDANTLRISKIEGGVPLPWRDREFSELPAVPTVELLFKSLDLLAVNGAPRSRWFSAGSISLNQIATVISGSLIAFKLSEEAAPVVKFLVVTLAACLPWIGSRFRINDTWMEARINAELLRSLLASHAFAPPLRPLAADLFQDEAPFLRSAAWKLIPGRSRWEQQRNTYLTERLDGQIGYMTSKGHLAARRLRILWRTFRIASVGAMILGAAAILSDVMDWQASGWTERIWLMFFPAILPAIAAWCLAMIALFEHKRRAKVYLHMAERLQAKRNELKEAKCLTTAAAVVATCERMLLTELWEWAGTRGKRKR